MNKAEFLRELEQHLHVLNDRERCDVLEEYAQHIDLKIANGQSEEEAVRDFGSPEELVAELLDAYHINSEYAAGSPENEKHSGKTQETVKNACRNVTHAVGGTVGAAGHLVGKAGKAVGNAGSRIFHHSKRDGGEVREGRFGTWYAGARLRRIERKEARRMKREAYFADRAAKRAADGSDGKLWIFRFWDGCVRLTGAVLSFCWKCCLLVTSIPFFAAGLCFLFLTGAVLILILQGYPVVGIGVCSLGMVLCTFGVSFLLCSWVFNGRKSAKSEALAVSSAVNETEKGEEQR